MVNAQSPVVVRRLTGTSRADEDDDRSQRDFGDRLNDFL